MADSPVQNLGERASEDDLSVCPICGGYTQIYNGRVYCPHDKIFVSSNPKDAMRAKVSLIKTEIVTIPETKKQLHQSFTFHVIVTIITGIALVMCVLIGLLGYKLFTAFGYEDSAQYQEAARVYESLWGVNALPQVKEHVVKLYHLAESEEAYKKGKLALENQEWQSAIGYFSLVDRADKNYPTAQESIRVAQDHLGR